MKRQSADQFCFCVSFFHSFAISLKYQTMIYTNICIMLCCLPALGTFYLSQSMRRKVSPYHTCPNQNRIFCMLHGEKKVTTSPRRRSEQRRPGGTAQTQANNSILNRNDRNLINTRICWTESEELHRERSSDAPDHPISLVWLQRDMGMQQQQHCRVERGVRRQVEGEQVSLT